MSTAPSDEARWYTPGVECCLCGGHSTELYWSKLYKGYVCKDIGLCGVTILMEYSLNG